MDVMRRTWLVLIVLAGCRFDASGPGVNGVQPSDAAVVDGAVVADAPPGTPDAPPGTPDARPTPDAPPGTPDARPTPDAMTMPDAMTTPDAGGTVGVACGAMTCTMGDDCCVTPHGGGQPPDFSCDTSCGQGELTYACDGPEDCPGQHCCLYNSGFTYGSACQDSCGNGGDVTCNVAGDCPNGGDQCCASGAGAIRVCRSSNSQCN
jgi:hypothetical protein